MPSAATAAPAAPRLWGAAQRRRFATHEREVELTVLGFDGWPATALYCIEWVRDEDWAGHCYQVPVVELLDLVGNNGTSLRNAAGRAQCQRIAEALEEHEYDAGPPDPPTFHHYD